MPFLPGFRFLFLSIPLLACLSLSAHAQAITNDTELGNNSSGGGIATPAFTPDAATSGAAGGIAAIQPIKQNEPVTFTSDTVDYDQQKQLVILRGTVELSQRGEKGIQTVKADEITFNQQTSKLTADGHVALIEPDGNVVFAEHIDLDQDLSNGFGQKVSGLLSDNSRFIANAAQRRDGHVLDMTQAIYSPCNLCETNPREAPLWQLKANRINHDTDTHDVQYEDAWMEFMGVPVFYTPYLAHPDPGVKRRQGFLAPTVGLSTTIGDSIRIPYYIDLAPDKDLTISPTFSTEDKAQIAGEYRERWDTGKLRLDASGTVTDLTTDNGAIKQDQPRGHIRGDAVFDLDEYWRAGGDLFLTSDDTYLQRYRIGAPDILQNRAYVEGFDHRDYAAAEAFYFQDTRAGVTQREPFVIPRLTGDAYSDPDASAIGGRFEITGGFLSLQRPGSSNVDTNRLSTSLNWSRTDTAPVGIVSTLSANALTDGYLANNYVNPSNGLARDQSTDARFFPSLQGTASYPLARQFGTVQQTLEPIVSVFTAPVVCGNDRIPNEDSLDFELDDTNIFRANRFTGEDRLEGGTRVTYGVKTGVYGYGGGSSSAFFGQSYRFRSDDNFAIGSGLEDRFSDYVGRIELDPASWLLADYSVRLDKDDLSPRKHELSATVGSNPLTVQAGYLYINQDNIIPGTNSNESEELSGSATINVTDYWSVTLGQRRSFAPTTGPLTSSAGVAYNDECLNFAVTAERDHTTRADLETGTSFYLRLLFKNLGGIETPTSAGNVFSRDLNNR